MADLSNSASPQLISRMLYLINTERQELGLPPLQSCVPLNRAAQAHCDDMAQRRFYGPTAPDDTGVDTWVQRTGYQGHTTAHIYTGPTSIAAVNAWMRSPSRQAILDPLARDMGIGLEDNRWTLLIGEPARGRQDTAMHTAAIDLDDLQEILPPEAHTRALSALPLGQQPTAAMAPVMAAEEAVITAEMTPMDAAPDPAPEVARPLERIAPVPAASPIIPAPAAAPPAMAAPMPQVMPPPPLAPVSAAMEEAAAPPPLVAAPPAPVPVDVAPPVPSWQQRPLPPPASAGPELRFRVLDLINEERARNRLPALEASDALDQAAQSHAEDMVRRGFFGHQGPEGEDAEMRAQRAGYPGRCGECLASGQATADAAVAFFIQDAGGRTGILSPIYQHLGVGMDGLRWVLLFGLLPQQAAAPPPQPAQSGRLRADLGALGNTLGTSLGGAIGALSGSLGGLLKSDKPPPGTNPLPDMAAANKMVALLNTERAKLSLPPLSLAEPLCRAAQAHSNDMLVKKYFAYTAPDGTGLEQRVAECGYAGRTGANLSMGQTTPEAALKAFLANEGNQANLLNAEYRHVGVGLAKGHWTLVFGIPQGERVTHSPQLVARLFELINQERGKAGLSGLSMNDMLQRAAQAHCEDMVRRNFSGSMTPEGEGVGPRVERVGYRWRSVSESTAVERHTAESVIEGWMKIGDHRDNVLDKEFRHVGIGMSSSRWSAIFARPY